MGCGREIWRHGGNNVFEILYDEIYTEVGRFLLKQFAQKYLVKFIILKRKTSPFSKSMRDTLFSQ